MNSRRDIRVFVSSTAEDLKDYRAVARNVVLDTGWVPDMMEHWSAIPNPSVQACRDKLAESDLMLLLVAFRRGWVPNAEQGGNGIDSITALELAYAREKKIPVLAMFADESWPGNQYEQEQGARAWVEHFRAGINLPYASFDSEKDGTLPAFRVKVRAVLVAQKERMLAEQAKVSEVETGLDYFDSACEGLIDGSSIPFIGAGVFGSGPLSPVMLAAALGKEGAQEQACLATACEYRERYLPSRERFLKHFRQIFENQSRSLTALPAVYSMLLRVKPPPLIVSTTCDLRLEKCLQEAGKSCAIVCHIVRSNNKEHDGKILVVKGNKSEICVADGVDVSGADYVIYKLLGSPMLNDLPDPKLGIDTLVLTETDHLLLLGRLEHQDTQVPTVFIRSLQVHPILFMGYTLDVWQYRLVMRVFESIGERGGRLTSLATRELSSFMEELAWKRLNTDLIRMDPNVFANRVSGTLAPGQGAA
jgi:hypothetical protein